MPPPTDSGSGPSKPASKVLQYLAWLVGFLR